MSVPLLLVDAFAEAPFGGNSAAVCLLDGPADAGWMQAVAAELRQPATAFVWPAGGRGDAASTREGPAAARGVPFGLRWFVAAAELTLCGHGTLAAAHALWESGRLPMDAPARFETVSGELTARRAADPSAQRADGLIALDFPADPVERVSPPPHLIEALGVEPVAVSRGRLDYLVELGSERAVRALRPDFARLRLVETRGVIVTAPGRHAGPDAAGDYDCVSRFFAPSVGLDEDAVTGSAHCAVGPYWGRRLGRATLRAYQASARGGVLQVRLDGSRVELAGRAQTVLLGSLLAGPPPAP
jgi:PhzF family phenazine biosynthesis protein